jgi:hypothetical protein
VDRYSYNISDEYPSLRRKSFWTRHQELGLFQLRKEEAADDGSRRAKPPLAAEFSEAAELDVGDFEMAAAHDGSAKAGEAREEKRDARDAMEGAEEAEEAEEAEVAEEAEEEDADIEVEEVDSVTLHAPMIRIQRIEGGSESSSTTDRESDEEDDGAMDYFAEFTDFPVQITLLEKAEGTMDELFDEDFGEEKEARWTAWTFQVIAALAAAQYWFGFVHNDLHTNNVLWNKTEKEFLYYRIHGKGGKTTVYRVPTFGYIMKIIDFGRASFHLPTVGFMISDAFFPNNDAAEQYNCDPFFDPRDGKRVEPNPSFDLCRLAVSMLEAVYPVRPANATPIRIMSREGPKTYAETVAPLYNLMWEWLTDDEGKNMLREPNGNERYPDFDLYAAIAADVHKAVPGQQLEKALFSKAYTWTEAAPAGETVYELWSTA